MLALHFIELLALVNRLAAGRYQFLQFTSLGTAAVPVFFLNHNNFR